MRPQRKAPEVIAPAGGFAEAKAWSAVGSGWRPLFGSFRTLGFSFEWHDFTNDEELDWGKSFHPEGVELCLNVSGTAVLQNREQNVELGPQTSVFYHQGRPELEARRRSGERHQFLTVEYSQDFLQRHLKEQASALHPVVKAVVTGKVESSQVAPVERLNTHFMPLLESLRHPPVFAAAQSMWFQCKALELATQLFFTPPSGEELFCTRQQRSARERVERVREILKSRLSEPPSLEELGRLVGCSPFYLSRLFSQEMGITTQQYLRQIRMERAAELLRTGKCNVTEAALEVGYNSLSHFSAAFHDTFGCCPGLYPLRTPTQGEGKGR
jgi:AraC-like DNA-binding protein